MPKSEMETTTASPSETKWLSENKTFAMGYLAHTTRAMNSYHYFVHHMTISYNFGPSLKYILTLSTVMLKQYCGIYDKTKTSNKQRKTFLSDSHWVIN